MTEVQKRFEADAYKQKMNYAGSAGIAAEQGFLAGMDRCLHLLQQHNVSGSLPPSLNYLKVLIPRAKVELEICLSELGHEPPILNRLVSKLEDFIGGNDR